MASPEPSATLATDEASDKPAQGAVTGDRLGWISLGVTALLTVWHVLYFVNLGPTNPDRQDVYLSVFLFVSVVLAVATAVLGIVALSQRARPRWPATAAVAIGVYGFLTVMASWIGGLLSAGS